MNNALAMLIVLAPQKPSPTVTMESATVTIAPMSATTRMNARLVTHSTIPRVTTIFAIVTQYNRDDLLYVSVCLSFWMTLSLSQLYDFDRNDFFSYRLENNSSSPSSTKNTCSVLIMNCGTYYINRNYCLIPLFVMYE